MIVCRANGFPILADAPSATPAESTVTERQWRDAQLSETDPMVARHRDELETAETTTLSVEQYAALQQYRRDLRNWPSSTQFPAMSGRPVLSVAGNVTVKKSRTKSRAKP
ncbi:phage tail assembly chaperone [Pseudomonas sp. Seg1]|uniref:phage tail assembly chaperone n=1 Tax=Pseudomonas sp. Seg1 TaxID=2678259 RepID=UPI001BB30A53|nr:phage tail assembly chaperone [Pseudomonas sp. Seg1]